MTLFFPFFLSSININKTTRNVNLWEVAGKTREIVSYPSA